MRSDCGAGSRIFGSRATTSSRSCEEDALGSKIENETFNTLKTQGYELEHNYGHGQQYLATVFALLTWLSFLVDQAQELGCRLFQAARAHFHSRTSLWERLRVLFTGFYIADWKILWEAIAAGHASMALAPDTS